MTPVTISVGGIVVGEGHATIQTPQDEARDPNTPPERLVELVATYAASIRENPALPLLTLAHPELAQALAAEDCKRLQGEIIKLAGGRGHKWRAVWAISCVLRLGDRYPPEVLGWLTEASADAQRGHRRRKPWTWLRAWMLKQPKSSTLTPSSLSVYAIDWLRSAVVGGETTYGFYNAASCAAEALTGGTAADYVARATELCWQLHELYRLRGER